MRSALDASYRLAICAALGAIGLSCSAEPEAEAANRPLVVVSAPPLGWFVESIAGDAVEVVSLLPPGASPTSFEPGIATLRAIEAASLVVAVGHPNFPFERTWFAELLRDRGDLVVLRGWRDADASGDPHWWLSPAAVDAFVEPLSAELTNLLPSHASAFAANLVRLHAQIRALDAELAAQFRAAKGRRFLVFHPSWGQFARHYDLDQIAIEDDGKAPDAYQLGLLIENARTAGFRHVIVQPQIDPAHAQSVADAIGASVVTLDPLAYSWAENLRAVGKTLATEVLVP